MPVPRSPAPGFVLGVQWSQRLPLMARQISGQPSFPRFADTRVTFSPDFLRAVRIRGLTLDELARSARVAPATVSAAVNGRRVNVSTALRISKAVAARPPIPELENWT
jgi:hypothetical protein